VQALKRVDVCLVTVKSHDTDAAASILADVLLFDSTVVSFQNGLHNADRLRQAFAGPVAAGMVRSNLHWDRPGSVRQATGGAVYAERLDDPAGAHMRALRCSLGHVGQPLRLRRDMNRVLAGKLLLNLHNGVCAATGMSIADSLRSRDARWCFARCLQEGMAVFDAAGVTPARLTPLPPRLLPDALMMPDPLFAVLARHLAAEARSSTLQDLHKGRPTEIDALNGEIVRLGQRVNVATHGNRTVVEAVRALESMSRRKRALRFVTARKLRQRIQTRTGRLADITEPNVARGEEAPR
jgi:2-dehydropantoate 2-reductase